MSLSVGTGLVSGLDFNDIVSRLMEIERSPIDQLELRRTGMQRKQNSYNTLNLRLNALRDTLAQIDTSLDFATKQASVSDTDALSASVTSSASAGSHSVEIIQLASGERRASQGVDDQTSTAIASGSGTFEFYTGDDSSDATSIDVNSSTTMQDLRDAINDAGSGITATIINDGTATNAYRLVLTSDATGASNSLTIVNNDTTLDFANSTVEAAVADDNNAYSGALTSSSESGFNGDESRSVVIEVTTAGLVGEAKFRVSLDGGATFGADDEFTTSTSAFDISGGEDIRAAFSDNGSTFAVGDRFTIDAFNPALEEAQDAMAKIDGITVSRSNNTFSDVIPGISFTAKNVTSSAETISITSDTSAVAGKIGNFVSAYNALVAELSAQTAFDVENNTSAPLFGESTARTIRTAISGAATSGIITSDAMLSLGGIGISVQRDGTLSVDSATLSNSIESDIDSLKKVFALVGESDTQSVSYISASASTKATTFSVSVSQAATRAQVTGDETIGMSGIVQTESLSFEIGGSSFNASLSAGSSLTSILSTLNSKFDDQGVALEAVDQDGKLSIRTTEYGSTESFTIRSSLSGAGQTGLSTSDQTVTGSDVVGRINGYGATGNGQTLSGANGSDAEGLKLLITATSATSANLTVSRGVAALMLDRIDNITDSTSGVLEVRREGLTTSIDDINEQIQRFETRMASREESLRQQFVTLETILAQYQSQGSFLSSQLAQISQM